MSLKTFCSKCSFIFGHYTSCLLRVIALKMSEHKNCQIFQCGIGRRSCTWSQCGHSELSLLEFFPMSASVPEYLQQGASIYSSLLERLWLVCLSVGPAERLKLLSSNCSLLKLVMWHEQKFRSSWSLELHRGRDAKGGKSGVSYNLFRNILQHWKHLMYSIMETFMSTGDKKLKICQA